MVRNWRSPGRSSTLRVSHSRSVVYGAFVFGAGRLTGENGGFRPGQMNPEQLWATLKANLDDHPGADGGSGGLQGKPRCGTAACPGRLSGLSLSGRGV